MVCSVVESSFSCICKMPSSSGSNVLHQVLPSRRLYTSLVVMAFNLSQLLRLVSGTRYCENTTDCVDSGYIPYICQDGRCVCNPERVAVSCIPDRIYGDKCRTEEDCHSGDVNLICASRTCRCRK
ncbi:hypothetical protein B566_EDAN000947 [Ephemera danica]|nr:hypothetical protein B566_EDAN000947 [Ephemera danica]